MKLSIAKTVVVFSIFLILGIAIYSNTFQAHFYFDDIFKIQKNAHIRVTRFSPKEFIQAGLASSIQRPVAYITFAANYYFHRYRVFGYHVVNTGIHILAAFFVYLLLKLTLSRAVTEPRFSSASGIAFFSALIWLVHPIHTQSVTYIVQRMNSMAAMFYILALYLYAQGRLFQRNHVGYARKKDSTATDSQYPPNRTDATQSVRPKILFAGTIISWLLAMGCKQIAITLPFFIFLYEWFFFQDLSRDWLRRQKKYLYLLLLITAILTAVFLGMHPIEKLSSLRDFSRGTFTYPERVLTQFRVVVFYISLLFFPAPTRLNLDHDFPLSLSLLDPITTLLSLLALTGLFILAFRTAKSHRLFSFSILWYLGNILLESSVLPLAIIFEHRTYLPSAFLPSLIVFGVLRLKITLWLKYALMSTLVLAGAFWAHERNKTWADAVTLWRDCVKKSPAKARCYANLSGALVADGKTMAAIENSRKAIELDPTLSEPHSNIGHALLKEERMDEAIASYRRAVELSPNSAPAHTDLGNALAKQDKNEDAVEHLMAALRIDPLLSSVHYTLGRLLKKSGNVTEANKHFTTVVKLDPEFKPAYYEQADLLAEKKQLTAAVGLLQSVIDMDPDSAISYYRLGMLYLKAGKSDAAIDRFEHALNLDPDQEKAHYNIGIALTGQGRLDEAIQHYREAVNLDPDYRDAHNNLANVLVESGHLTMAIEHYRESLRIDPDYADAHGNLGMILLKAGKIDPAVEHLQDAVRLRPGIKEIETSLRQALVYQNELDQALASLRTDLEAYPQNPALHFKMAELYKQSGNPNEAVAAYRRAIAIEPRYNQALAALVGIHIQEKNYHQAVEVLHQMRALWPQSAGIYYNIACMYALQDQRPKALDWLRQAIDRGYDNWDLIKTDPDLTAIRDNDEYKKLIKGH